ncbi:MAG TPA: metal-sensitive transcriptional regulator [Candidatus Saccharimonadales bacterium]|nr:metal-sensitive transcriptional regulator [Candidatus Saccharimonadales bacterium]
MQYGYYNNKPAVVSRLNRIEGQVRGIANMVREDKYCIDILTQISAAQAALDKVALALMHDHATHCMVQVNGVEEQSKKADELVGAISRLLSR